MKKVKFLKNSLYGNKDEVREVTDRAAVQFVLTGIAEEVIEPGSEVIEPNEPVNPAEIATEQLKEEKQEPEVKEGKQAIETKEEKHEVSTKGKKGSKAKLTKAPKL